MENLWAVQNVAWNCSRQWLESQLELRLESKWFDPSNWRNSLVFSSEMQSCSRSFSWIHFACGGPGTRPSRSGSPWPGWKICRGHWSFSRTNPWTPRPLNPTPNFCCHNRNQAKSFCLIWLNLRSRTKILLHQKINRKEIFQTVHDILRIYTCKYIIKYLIKAIVP